MKGTLRTMDSFVQRTDMLPPDLSLLVWRRAAVTYLLAARKVATRCKCRAAKLVKRVQEHPPILVCADGAGSGFYRWPGNKRLFKATAPLTSLRKKLKAEEQKWARVEEHSVKEQQRVRLIGVV